MIAIIREHCETIVEIRLYNWLEDLKGNCCFPSKPLGPLCCSFRSWGFVRITICTSGVDGSDSEFKDSNCLVLLTMHRRIVYRIAVTTNVAIRSIHTDAVNTLKSIKDLGICKWNMCSSIRSKESNEIVESLSIHRNCLVCLFIRHI